MSPEPFEPERLRQLLREDHPRLVQRLVLAMALDAPRGVPRRDDTTSLLASPRERRRRR